MCHLYFIYLFYSLFICHHCSAELAQLTSSSGSSSDVVDQNPFKHLANCMIFASLYVPGKKWTPSHAERWQITPSMIRRKSTFLFLQNIWRSFSASVQRSCMVCCHCCWYLSWPVTLSCLALFFFVFSTSPPPFHSPGALCRPCRSVRMKNGKQRGGILSWAANLCGHQGHFAIAIYYVQCMLWNESYEPKNTLNFKEHSFFPLLLCVRCSGF